MKKTYLLGAAALPLMFTACSNEDFNVVNNESQAVSGDKIELPEGFALVGSKGNTDSRSGVIDNKLGWYPTSTGNMDATEILNEENWDKLGLAWLNVCNAQNGQIYSNYEFVHYGWLNVDATEPDYDKCDNNTLTNGVWFTGDANQDNQFKNQKGNVGGFWNTDIYEFTDTNFEAVGVSANKGLFKTSFGTIFGGDYLAYYPYNPSLKNVDYLRAVSPAEFTNKDNKSEDIDNASYTGDYYTNLAPHYFLVGKTNIEGGTQASQFTMGQLSGGVAVKVVNESGSPIDNISSVALYSADGFYTSVALDAQKITNSSSALLGQELYAAGVTDNKTVATLVSKASSNVTLSDDEYTVFGFAALPKTISNCIVIVQDKDGNSYAQKIGELEIKAHEIKGVTITLTQDLSAASLYAYNETSFRTALALANDNAPSTINLLGEVTLTDNYTINNNVTVSSKTDADKLIVARNNNASKELTVAQGATLDCDVDLQGTGCCNLHPGKLQMNGDLAKNRTITNFGSEINFGHNNTWVSNISGTIVNTVDPEDDANNPSSIIINNKTTVELRGNIINEEGNSLTIQTSGDGSTGYDATLNIYKDASLTNNGNVTIYGNLATETGGEFINNNNVTVKVSAQITGKGVTKQADNAEYICEVNSEVRFNDALNNRKDAIHYTTLVRFIDSNDVKYTLAPNNGSQITNKEGNVINFESKISNDKQLTIEAKNVTIDGIASPVTTEIGDFTVLSGGFVMSHPSLTIKNFVVDYETAAARWFQLNEKMTVNENVDIKNYSSTAADKPMNIAKGINVKGNIIVGNIADDSRIVFAKSSTSNIEGDINVKSNGRVNFLANSITTIKNTFYNEGKVNITPQTAVTGTDVAARVICKEFTNFGDKTKWENGSYPQNILN